MGGVGADWLAQLAPAHAPPPIGWWPIAPGWWGLVIALTAAIVAALHYLSRPQARLRRAALRELKRLESEDGDDAALARGLEGLLRRYAVARFGREAVARLSGSRWIEFVVAHGGTGLAGASGSSLLSLAYGGQALVDRKPWLDGARSFLKDRS